LSVPFAPKGRNVNKEHQAIVNAAFARDSELAVRLISAHLTTTTRILLNAVVKGKPLLDNAHDRDAVTK
jgi:DNA-binding GntR family transcriptional regulator